MHRHDIDLKTFMLIISVINYAVIMLGFIFIDFYTNLQKTLMLLHAVKSFT